MSEQDSHNGPANDNKGGENNTSALRKGSKGGWHWIISHPLAALQLLILLLATIVVLQNLEPTHLNILFWSVAEVPKLAMLVFSMLFGALFWEGLRRQLVRRQRRRQQQR